MLFEKIRRGVLLVSTNSGMRYVEPSLKERLHLMWTFRNFNVLPEEVLKPHERELIEHLREERPLMRTQGIKDAPVFVIGTIEAASPGKRMPQRATSAAMPAASQMRAH